jgi:hypothetical protein
MDRSKIGAAISEQVIDLHDDRPKRPYLRHVRLVETRKWLHHAPQDFP